ASTTDSVIRGISLLRRVGSIFVVGFIFMLLLGDGYNKIHARFKISELRDLSANGVSTLATVHPEYEIKMRNYKPELTFQYSFTEGGNSYSNAYTLYQHLPEDSEALRTIFTVHYLKDDPSVNSLNVAAEMRRVEKYIEESSTFWTIVKFVAFLLVGLILFAQIRALIREVKAL